MNGPGSAAARLWAVALLERATGYARYAVSEVTADDLHRPTPCSGWDLRTLITHLNDSVATIGAGADDGALELFDPSGTLPGSDPLATFRERACHLLSAWAGVCSDEPQEDVTIADRELDRATVAHIGAIEIAVHGWDVSRACSRCRPIPPALAVDLLTVARTVVDGAARPVQFAAPVASGPGWSPSDRLVAFLGRDPRG